MKPFKNLPSLDLQKIERFAIEVGKTRRRQHSADRPKQSGKTAVFSQSDRPHGVKCAAFQTENALEQLVGETMRAIEPALAEASAAHAHSSPNLIEIIKNIRTTIRGLRTLFANEETTLQYGDIIGICRGLYDHYGVYVSNDCVIHYSTPDGSDISANAAVIETSLHTFCNGDSGLFKLHFRDDAEIQGMTVVSNCIVSRQEPLDFLRSLQEVRIYSPEETVARARSRLGEKKYNLLLNNCEHFALWCKTGVSKSSQVDQVFKLLKRRHV